jgi:hypothetical protein
VGHARLQLSRDPLDSQTAIVENEKSWVQARAAVLAPLPSTPAVPPRAEPGAAFGLRRRAGHVSAVGHVSAKQYLSVPPDLERTVGMPRRRRPARSQTWLAFPFAFLWWVPRAAGARFVAKRPASRVAASSGPERHGQACGCLTLIRHSFDTA